MQLQTYTNETKPNEIEASLIQAPFMPSRQETDQAHSITPRMGPLNPLKPNPSNYNTLPYGPSLPFLIFDIWALWLSALSARVPECQKLKMVG